MSTPLPLKFLVNMTRHLELWCLSLDSYFGEDWQLFSELLLMLQERTFIYSLLQVFKIVKIILLDNIPVQLEDVHSSNLINKLSDLSSQTIYVVSQLTWFIIWFSNWISFTLSKISHAHTWEEIKLSFFSTIIRRKMHRSKTTLMKTDHHWTSTLHSDQHDGYSVIITGIMQ